MDGGLEQPQIDEIEYLKLTDELKREMPDLLTDIKNPLDGFKKDEYEQAFLAYIKEHDDILREIEDVYVCSTNAKEGMQTLAQEFVEYVKTSLETETKKRKRSQKLMDYNMILVVYLFPALLKQNQRSGEAFAKALLQEWNQAFPKTNLHLASYEEIAEGFRQRFCYITTAVCQSLNKGDNCEELVLLRGYRDGYLMGLPGGQRVIQEYYDVAPTIVKHINRRENAEDIYRGIYETYLRTCIGLIREDKNEQCRKVYTDMVYELEDKYFS